MICTLFPLFDDLRGFKRVGDDGVAERLFRLRFILFLIRDDESLSIEEEEIILLDDILNSSYKFCNYIYIIWIFYSLKDTVLLYDICIYIDINIPLQKRDSHILLSQK